MTRSSTTPTLSPEKDFISQHLLSHPEQGNCSFTDPEIDAKKASGAFPEGTVFRPFDARAKSDFTSLTWIYFLAFTFSIGYTYPFLEFTTKFFEVIGLSYAQTMPMVWRTLFTIEEIKRNQVLDIDVAELAYAYEIRAHGSHRFLLKTKAHQLHLILKNTLTDPYWKYRFFL